MRQIAPALWVVETPLRGPAFGLPGVWVEVGRRMSICRLGGGRLWIHCPAPLTDELRRSLEALGEPRFVVPANAYHGHRFMEEYRAAYPAVELFATPGLERRRKDLEFDAVLGDVPDPRWCEDLDQAVFLGHHVPEVVFLHRASRTLIVGDLVTGPFPPGSLSARSRLYWRVEGIAEEPGTMRTYRLTTRDRRAARAALERILEWDFDRVLVGHGEPVETDGHAAFERAMAWLTGS
jgi:hypothetical protein